VNAPPRARHRVGRAIAGAAAATRHRARPVDAGVWHQIGDGEVAPQTLARLQLMRLDQHAAATRAASGKPDQRAFKFVDSHLGVSEAGVDLLALKREMLGTETIDRRLWRFGSARPPPPGGRDCDRFGGIRHRDTLLPAHSAEGIIFLGWLSKKN